MYVQRQTSPKANNMSLIVPQINSKDLLPFETDGTREREERGRKGVDIGFEEMTRAV